MTCTRCNDEMWVCEDHSNRPWNYGDGCGAKTECCWFRPFYGFQPGECQFVDGCHDGRPCEMAGAPCPDCNDPGPGLLPMAAVGVPLMTTSAPRGDNRTEGTAP